MVWRTRTTPHDALDARADAIERDGERLLVDRCGVEAGGAVASFAFHHFMDPDEPEPLFPDTPAPLEPSP